MDEATDEGRVLTGRIMVVAGLIAWSLRPEARVRRASSRHATRRTSEGPGLALEHLCLAGAAVLLMALSPLAAALVVSGLVVRMVRRRSRVERARMVEVERTLPDAIDLLSLVVSAGVPPRRAVAMVAPRCPTPHREAWAAVTVRIDAGQGFIEALSRLTVLLGPSVRPMVTALIAFEQDGVALAPALERCGAEAHRRRRVRAEEAARRVPVLMLFPLVCCVLPAFGLLTIVPLLAGSVSDLQLPA